MRLKVKYFDTDMPKLEQTVKGDWIDLRVANAFVCQNKEHLIKDAIKQRRIDSWDEQNRIYFCAGDVVIVRLGVAIELPLGKKVNIYPRSSTFATWGLLLTNSVGCIDYLYKGDNDEWIGVFFATREGWIVKYDRLLQFDAVDRTSYLLEEVETLGDTDRGGYGTTGEN